MSATDRNPLKIPHAEYLRIEAVSNSLLKQVGQSPAHAKEWLKNPPEPTPAMLFGSLAHTAILEPELFNKNYVVSPKFDCRTNAGKQAKAGFIDQNGGRTLISEDQFEQVLGMIKSVYDHKRAGEMLSSGESEMSFVVRDRESDLLCKCRPDHINGQTLIDVKTCEDASFASFSKTIFNFGYHQQAALYLDLVAQAGVRVERFIIIAVEKKAPYAVAVYELDHATIEKGQEIYRRNLGVWTQCLKSNLFPAYSEEIVPIAIPSWGFNE